MKARTFVILGLSALLAACMSHGHDHPHSDNQVVEGQAHEGHHHTAPHGGALVVFGEEFAHLEFVLAADSGTLTAYSLDGEAEKAVRLPGVSSLEIALEGGDKLSLDPVADELTGETVEDTSTFRTQNDSLKGLEEFEATITAVNIKGREFENVKFHFPEGNESDHGHKGEEHDHDGQDHDHEGEGHEHESL